MQRVFYHSKAPFDPKKQAVCIVNGIFDEGLDLERLKKAHLIISVDGGLLHCAKYKIKPHLLVGDFDSINPEILKEFADCKKISLQKKKDVTDLERALQEMDWNKVERVTLIAGFGKRIDHVLGHLFILTRYPLKVFMESSHEFVFALGSGQEITLETFPGQILSLYPLVGKAIGVTTEGLVWELKEKTLDQQFVSQSNECVGNRVHLKVGEGSLICILNN